MFPGEWRAWMLLPVTVALTIVFLAFAVNDHVWVGAVIAALALAAYARGLFPAPREPEEPAPRADDATPASAPREGAAPLPPPAPVPPPVSDVSLSARAPPR